MIMHADRQIKDAHIYIADIITGCFARARTYVNSRTGSRMRSGVVHTSHTPADAPRVIDRTATSAVAPGTPRRDGDAPTAPRADTDVLLIEAIRFLTQKRGNART